MQSTDIVLALIVRGGGLANAGIQQFHFNDPPDLFNKGNGIIPVNCTKIEYLSNRKKIESVKSVRTVLKSDCIDGKKALY